MFRGITGSTNASIFAGHAGHERKPSLVISLSRTVKILPWCWDCSLSYLTAHTSCKHGLTCTLLYWIKINHLFYGVASQSVHCFHLSLSWLYFVLLQRPWKWLFVICYASGEKKWYMMAMSHIRLDGAYANGCEDLSSVHLLLELQKHKSNMALHKCLWVCFY